MYVWLFGCHKTNPNFDFRVICSFKKHHLHICAENFQFMSCFNYEQLEKVAQILRVGVGAGGFHAELGFHVFVRCVMSSDISGSAPSSQQQLEIAQKHPDIYAIPVKLPKPNHNRPQPIG